MANIFSFVILVLLLLGRRFARGQVRLHAAWMCCVIGADLALILYLVLARNALSKVTMSMPVLLGIHVVLALSTVVVYLLAVWIGFRRLRDLKTTFTMRQIDRVIVPLRVTTFLTSLALQMTSNS